MRRAEAFAPLLAAGTLLVASGANNVGGRLEALSHQMMCTCGCAELLGECNHVGCPNSGPMLAMLQKDIVAGMTDHGILVAFEQQWGPTVLASPLLTRFNQSAWIVPPAILILGLLAALVLLRRRGARVVAKPLAVRHPAADAQALARVRRETREL